MMDDPYEVQQQQVVQALRIAAEASCGSLNAAFEKDGKQAPDVFAFAVLRLAGDHRAHAESLAQLLEPQLQQQLQDLGVLDLAVAVPHYTSVLTLQCRLARAQLGHRGCCRPCFCAPCSCTACRPAMILLLMILRCRGQYRKSWLTTYVWPIMSLDLYSATADVFLDGMRLWWVESQEGCSRAMRKHCVQCHTHHRWPTHTTIDLQV